MKLSYAFSLIELMIVIAIIGLLSAVAGPSYKNYIFKSKVATAMTIGDSFRRAALLEGAGTGEPCPTSFTFSGFTYSNGSHNWTPVDNVRGFSYYRTTGSICAFCYMVENIGMPNQVNGNSRVASEICLRVNDDGSTVRTYCGGWAPGGGNNVDNLYRPQSCQCDDTGAATPSC